ncbi:MAG: helix-turn-helix domain-containing protein [Aquamicrobium sp.]|uniref:helix-turn-helix transcriptional regulator n=1 Tax=Aquamicrobium sp. TaxID=1872579 RepID=UPI00349EB9BE|nr:helix-turn-helix domain-containing protein [Aquamicrobium sp.]MCO5158970.1 helix-turn-helix domain-containing protein [Aquamicrobium sp.]
MAYLRVPQAAEYIGVSKSLLDKLRCYGGGPAYAKLGTSVIYNTDDLDAWVAARRIEPANDNVKERRAAA